jgi:HAD superfamily hydrolase (TIGR01490 family)
MRDAKTAAIFDVDGTLITGPTLERTFNGFLFRMNELSPRDVAAWVKDMATGIPIHSNKGHLRGKSESRLRTLARICFEREITPRLLPAALDRIRWHRVSGHEIALISGTLEVLLAPLAELLGASAALGTQLEASGGVLTGRISGIHPFSKDKVTSVFQLQKDFDFDLDRSFAYANHHTDRHLLSSVGRPVATNPDRGLRRLARSRGWMIEDFETASTADTSLSGREEAH